VSSRLSVRDTVGQLGPDRYSFCGKRTFELSPPQNLWVDDPVALLTTMYLEGKYTYMHVQNATVQVGLEEYPDLSPQSI